MAQGDGFKAAVARLLAKDIYPSPSAIQLDLGRIPNGNLNGKECKWRDEIWESWMLIHPEHPITTQRKKRSVREKLRVIDVFEQAEAIRGLREIIADLE